MKIASVDIEATIEKACALVDQDEQMSAATKSIVEVLILMISLLGNRLNFNSTKYVQ